MRAGQAIVLAFAVVILAASVVAVAYKAQEAGTPARSMRFERWDDQDLENRGFAGGVQALEFRAVHSTYFLEDHLDTASQKGHSEERVRLRVDSLTETLVRLTGQPGPTWFVSWEGVVIRVHLDDGKTPDMVSDFEGEARSEAVDGPANESQPDPRRPS